MAAERETFAPVAERTAIYERMSDSVYHDIRSNTDALFERSYPIFH